MIQINLLPDIKLQYLHARQRKRMVVGISAVVSIFFLVIFISLFSYVRFGQKNHLSNLNKDIQKVSTELKSKNEIDKVLTIQNQINALPGLHNDKDISSRLFEYLTQLTPNEVTISDVSLDLETHTLNIKGNSDAFSTVNKFADTLKFTDFESFGDPKVKDKAFSNVVLKSFSISSASSGNQDLSQPPVAYELDFSFNPIIFQNAPPASGDKFVILNVPSIISTRSVIEKPKDLFVPQPESSGEGSN